jgi:hypothetical protein
MDAVDYKILKGAATQQFGVCSRETLNRLMWKTPKRGRVAA